MADLKNSPAQDPGSHQRKQLFGSIERVSDNGAPTGKFEGLEGQSFDFRKSKFGPSAEKQDYNRHQTLHAASTDSDRRQPKQAEPSSRSSSSEGESRSESDAVTISMI